MRTRVVDIIVYLMENLQAGKNLGDIDLDQFSESSINRSEISAAYSWVIQKKQMDAMEKALNSSPVSSQQNHRILHVAERLVIKSEAYGYLLELANIGMLNEMDIEHIIENIMINTHERVDLEKMKKLVSRHLFASGRFSPTQSTYLKGNESIN